MGKSFSITIFLSLFLICNSANGQEQKQHQNTSDRGIDLTEIVVTALVLGFGYSVLQSFKGKNE